MAIPWIPHPANMLEQHLPAICGQLSCNIWREMLAGVATYPQDLFGVDSVVMPMSSQKAPRYQTISFHIISHLLCTSLGYLEDILERGISKEIPGRTQGAEKKEQDIFRSPSILSDFYFIFSSFDLIVINSHLLGCRRS